MQFSNLTFLFLFLPITLLVYYLVPFRYKNPVFFAASLIFYAWGEPAYLPLLLFSVVFNYFIGRMIDQSKENPQKKKLFFLSGLFINVGLLVVFKYLSLLVSSLNGVLPLSIPDPQLKMPLGISFYTFQILSYLIGIYWGKFSAEKNFVTVGTYITAFTQITSGPITRYETIQPEMHRRKINRRGFCEGVELFVIGLAKKMLLANHIAGLWTVVKAMNPSDIPFGLAWVGIIGFAFQLYFDFSGYTQMAIGIGRMMGFHLPENFNDPYMSTSVSDFWRRWHMTLGAWFREFIYIPLGGNRGGTKKTLRNIFVVWLLTGIWHGAQWNFLFWGLYFGIILTLEKFIWGKHVEKWPTFLRIFYSFFFVCIGWVLFEFISPVEIFAYLGSMFGASGMLWNGLSSYYFAMYGIVFLLCALFSTPYPRNLMKNLMKRFPKFWKIFYPLFLFFIFVLSVAVMVTSTYQPFLYAQF